MTVVLPGQTDDIRWYEFRRWLSPFSRWRGSMVTPLAPEEIGTRLYARVLAVPQPETTGEAMVKSIRRLLGEAPRMTEQERRSDDAHVTTPWSGTIAENDPVYGILTHDGFAMARYKVESVRFRGRYHRTPSGGTRIDTTFGWHWSWRWLMEVTTTLQLVTLLFVAIIADQVWEIFGSVSTIEALAFSLFVLLTAFGSGWEYVGFSWSRRHDYQEYCNLIAELLDTREIGRHQ